MEARRHWNPGKVDLDGRKTLAELFDGRSQSVINHFMLGPGWKEGCVGCSFGADHMGCLVHLEHDYHVSFTPEELAKGEVYYNYRMTDGGMEAESIRMRWTTSPAPIPVVRAATRNC